MIKSSKHTIKFARIGKQERLKEFLSEYTTAVEWYVNDLWNHKFVVGNNVLNIRNNQLSTISFYPANKKPPNSDLSGRALKCASTQAMGMINSIIKKRQKQLFKLKKLQKQRKDTRTLQRKISKYPLVKPNVENISMELNSICVEFIEANNYFDGFIKFSSIGKKFGKILIPIKMSKHSRKLENKGEMMKSFLISKNNIDIRWKIPDTPLKKRGKVVGADQGILTCVTLSDEQTTKSCPHGHDLQSIQKKMSRKTRGSIGFKKCQNHRKNYINWSINQLNLSNIKEIKLEKLKDVGKRQKKSRFLSHFTYQDIRDKIIDVCSEHGVRVKEQTSFYRSQRCNDCGYVHKSNRNGKQFKCKNCGLTKDADLNAAINHEKNLVKCPFDFRSQENRKGFFWIPEQEPTVPV